jgi:hypothetical protein
MEPKTLLEMADDTKSGSRIGVRAAQFTVGGKPRGAVIMTIRVPGNFALTGDDDSVAASITLNPDEGLGIGDWLRQAFAAADQVGPGVYDQAEVEERDEQPLETVQGLPDALYGLFRAWCDRRAIRALRAVLAGWPSNFLLTDDWLELQVALKNTIAFAREELLPKEVEMVADMIAAIDRAIDARSS